MILGELLKLSKSGQLRYCCRLGVGLECAPGQTGRWWVCVTPPTPLCNFNTVYMLARLGYLAFKTRWEPTGTNKRRRGALSDGVCVWGGGTPATLGAAERNAPPGHGRLQQLFI